MSELTVPQIDFSTLGNLGQVYQQAQARRTLADLGTQLSNGTIDYNQAAGKLAATGNLNGTLQLLALGQKQKQDAASAAAIQTAFGYGGVQPSGAPSAATGGPVVPNDSNAIPGTVGMNQRLADLSSDFIQDNPNTNLSSGVRSTADQARLYANRDSNPNPVAPPGSSNHERGLAVDIGGMTPEQRSMLPQYGLAQPVANDPPHVELASGVVAPPSGGSEGLSREQLSALTANPTTRPLAMAILKDKLTGNRFTQETDADGNIWNINKTTGQKVIALKASETKEGGGLSLNPIYGKDANGNTVLLQTGKNGTAVQSKLPEGVTLNGVDNETLASDAARLNAGDQGILKKYSNRGQGRVDLLRLNNEANRQREAAGLAPIDLTQNTITMAGDLARERSAGNMEGRMAPASIEAQGAFKIAQQASEALLRTNFVPFNKILQAGQRAMSDPSLKAASTAYNTAVMTYSRAIVPTGVGTVTAQEHARQILAEADGPAATKAAFEQLSREVEMAHESPGLARQYFADARKARLEGKPPPPMPQYTPSNAANSKMGNTTKSGISWSIE